MRPGPVKRSSSAKEKGGRGASSRSSGTSGDASLGAADEDALESLLAIVAGRRSEAPLKGNKLYREGSGHARRTERVCWVVMAENITCWVGVGDSRTGSRE